MSDLPEDGREGPEESIELDHFPEIKWHDDEELIKKAMPIIYSHFRRFQPEQQEYEEKVLAICDWMAKTGIDASKLNTTTDGTPDATADTDATEADTGSTMVYTTIRVLATQLASVIFSDEQPFKYVPATTGFNGMDSLEEGKPLSEQYNRLARKTMELDGFQKKFIEALFQLIKYGNIPLYLGWKYEVANRRDRMPIRGVDPDTRGVDPDTGAAAILGFEFITREVVTANHPCLKVIPPENFYADRTVPDLKDQDCIIVKSKSSYSDLWKEQRAGNYHNIEELGSQHLFKGDEDSNMSSTRAINVDVGEADQIDTGQFLIYDVYLRIPIDDDGKWDAEKNEWVWYWMTIAGGLNDGKVIRYQRNPDPDDEPPFMMLHAQPDDGTELYHFGHVKALESNFREATTAKNQMIDSKTIQMRRPMLRKMGEVYSTDVTYASNKIIDVEDVNTSLKSMDVPSVVFDCRQVMEMLDNDSKRAVGMQDSVIGEAMGGRTSASEANNAFNQALQPSMISVRYVTQQFFPWYGRKLYRLWQLYSLPDQVMELTHEEQRFPIHPARLYGEFDVKVSIVDQYVSDQTSLQNFDYILQNAAAIPQLAETINWEAFAMELMRARKTSEAPATFIKKGRNLEAEQLAENEHALMNAGQTPPVEAEQNHEVHLLKHNAMRASLKGLEAEPEYAGWIDILEAHIAQHESASDQQAAAVAQQSQAPAPTEPGLPSQLNQAALGSLQG